MPTLTVIILTYNEQTNIIDCIDFSRFADRIIVFDSGSTDDTVDYAREAGAEVITHPFENYAAQRNAALDAVTGSTDWVLFVDADERITPDLAHEVESSITYPGYAGFRIPRHNYIFDKLTLGAGWFPDYQTRLLKVGSARLDPAQEVHEVVILDGLEGTLKNPFIHYNYRSVSQFIMKQKRYAQINAKMSLRQGIRPRKRQFISMPLRHFWWRFVTLHGYSDGLHGLRLSLLMAWYEFYRLRALKRLWDERDYAK